MLNQYETRIYIINFYSHEELIANTGNPDWFREDWNGRLEEFVIAEDEQLIGCELDHDEFYFRGITWLKMKLY